MDKVQFQEWTISTYHDLDSIRPIWEALFDADPQAGPFMSWQYAATWWKHFGQPYSPILLVAERQADPCGRVLLPLMRDGSELRWFATPGSDQVAVLREHAEDVPGALKAFAAHLGDQRWSKLSLTYLPQDHAEQFLEAFKDYSNRIEENTGSPYIDTEGRSWEDYRMSLSHSRRADMRAVVRKLENADIALRFDVATDPDGIERLFPVMRDLTLAGPMPEKHLLVTGEQGDFLLDLLRDYSARQWVKLVVMYLDEKPVAYSICYTMNGVTGYWRADYDGQYQEFSPGKLLLYHLLQASFDGKDKTFDFMQGLERYKLLWTDAVKPLSYVIFYRNALHGQLAHLRARLAER